MSKSLGRVFTASVCVLLTSCSMFSGPRQPRFRTQEDVGTVQVGIQSVASFEDYISTLEPQFELKPQDALQSAITLSQVEDSALVSQFLATLQIALPQITRTRTSAVTNDGTDTTSTSSDTRSSTPGTTAAPTIPGVATPTVTTTLPATAAVDLNSALRFRAATALAQEVALLNHYVRNAAVRTGTKPYIVRLLLTVMPSTRNQPYDAYTTISFFSSKKQPQPVQSSLYAPLEALTMTKRATLKTLQSQCAEVTPLNVVPLLVTDDLESSLHSDSLQRIRDIAVALQGTLSNIGVSTGSRSHSEELDKTLSRNLNSIYALGQPASNAVVARLGAAFANGKFVTVPRTYGVTLLVLVKTAAAYDDTDPAGNEAIPCPGVSFHAVTQMHDAHRRGFVPPRKAEATERELAELLAAKSISMSDVDTRAMLRAAATADFASVSAVPDAVLAWSDAVWVSQRSGRSAGDFVVSLPRASLPSTNGDRFSLIDDGKTTTLSINHAASLLPDRLHAVIKAQLENDWIFLTNNDVQVSGYGRAATFTFPSLSKILEANTTKDTAGNKVVPVAKHVYAEVTYGRSLASWNAGTNNGGPELTWSPAFAPGQTGDAFVQAAVTAGIIKSGDAPISYVLTKKEEKEPAAPGFAVAVPAAVLANADGSGKMLVEIRNADPAKPRTVHLRVIAGGYIDKDSEPPRTGPDHIATAGAWLVNLNGLRPGTPLLLRAFRMEGDTSVAVEDVQVQVVLTAKKEVARPRIVSN